MTLSSRTSRSAALAAMPSTTTTLSTATLPRSGQEDVGAPLPTMTSAAPDKLPGDAEMDCLSDDEDAELAPTSPNPAADACSPQSAASSIGCLTPTRSFSDAAGAGGPATPAAELRSQRPACTPDGQEPMPTPQPQPAPTCAYRISRKIGSGCAEVFRATVLSSNIPDAPRGAQVAVKIYETRGWKKDQFKNVRGEVSAMSKLHHRNIVAFHSCKYDNGEDRQGGALARGYGRAGAREALPRIIIVQELCSQSDLFDNVKRYGAMPEDVAKHYCCELLQSVAYMHARHVAHRDVKLENIVLSSDWVLKVCDFGHAVQWAGDVKVPLEFHCAGTQRYRSPEVQAKARTDRVSVPGELDEANWYDPRLTDSWAAAVVFFEMLLGYPPMTEADPQDWYFDKIRSGRWDLFWGQHEKMCARSAALSAKLAPEMRRFFEAVFQPDPARRLTVAQMLKHPYLSGAGMTDTAVAAVMRRRCR